MQDDLEKLKSFITNVYNWLDVCYTGETNTDSILWPTIPVDRRLEDVAKLAWEEFKNDHPLDSFLAKLEPTSTNLESHLKTHGLLGAQLKYKLQLIDYAAKNIGSSTPEGWKRKLIDLIDNVLDSLAPIGIAGALNEIKHALVYWI